MCFLNSAGVDCGLASYLVATKLYNLQRSIEDSKRPDLKIWPDFVKADAKGQVFNGYRPTLVNLGDAPLPMKRIFISADRKNLDISLDSARLLDSKKTELSDVT